MTNEDVLATLKKHEDDLPALLEARADALSRKNGDPNNPNKKAAYKQANNAVFIKRKEIEIWRKRAEERVAHEATS